MVQRGEELRLVRIDTNRYETEWNGLSDYLNVFACHEWAQIGLVLRWIHLNFDLFSLILSKELQ